MNQSTRRILFYLLLIAAFWAFTFVTLNLWLAPYAAAFEKTGVFTAGYAFYALIGLLFSTPAPFWSVLLLTLCREGLGLKTFFKRLLDTKELGKTALLTALFCLAALLFALLRGRPNGEAWYLLPLGFLVMLPFVGLAEEAGWRGFLQPELEKRLKYPISVLLTAAIWAVWHIDQWFDPASAHFGDSFPGFCVNLLVWSFALAALYKETKSVPACAVYHAFVNAIGAVFDWNALFDPFPGDIFTNSYRAAVLLASIALWLRAEKRENMRPNSQTQILTIR